MLATALLNVLAEKFFQFKCAKKYIYVSELNFLGLWRNLERFWSIVAHNS